eukprot:207414_1
MGSSPNRKHSSKKIWFHRIINKQTALKNMKRRRAQRSSKSSRSKSKSKIRSNSSKSNAINNTDFDEISRKELQDDNMRAIMDDLNGYHHCRICNQTFNTKSTAHFIPQWLSHKSSKKHGNNKNILFKKLKNGKVIVGRSSSHDLLSSSSYHEEDDEEEETEETDETEETEEDEDDLSSIIINHSKQKANFRRIRNNKKK